MTVDGLQTALRAVGAVAYAVALTLAAIHAGRRRNDRVVTGAGAARTLGVIPAYLITAVPYFAVCAVLWRPLPVDPCPAVTLAAALAAAVLGAAGFGLYLWGHAALGTSYDLSSGLGTVIHADANLVTTGPFAFVRHPMYLGVVLGGVAGLLLYRTWTFVWVLASTVALVHKAHVEDRLLAERFGGSFARYRQEVPGWIPVLRRRRPRAEPTPAPPPAPS